MSCTPISTLAGPPYYDLFRCNCRVKVPFWLKLNVYEADGILSHPLSLFHCVLYNTHHGVRWIDIFFYCGSIWLLAKLGATHAPLVHRHFLRIGIKGSCVNLHASLDYITCKIVSATLLSLTRDNIHHLIVQLTCDMVHGTRKEARKWRDDKLGWNRKWLKFRHTTINSFFTHLFPFSGTTCLCLFEIKNRQQVQGLEVLFFIRAMWVIFGWMSGFGSSTASLVLYIPAALGFPQRNNFV